MSEHANADVNAALVRLNDALCTWERATGRTSVLILREEGGWSHRSVSGKPGVPGDVPDSYLLASVSAPTGSIADVAEEFGRALTANVMIAPTPEDYAKLRAKLEANPMRMVRSQEHEAYRQALQFIAEDAQCNSLAEARIVAQGALCL